MAKFFNTGLTLESFDSEQCLLSTLPRSFVNLFNEFVEFHDIILPQVFPTGYIHNAELFDLDNCLFYGPYSNGNLFQVEQRQPD